MLLRRVHYSYRETNHNSSRVFSNGTSDNDAEFTLVTGRKNSVTHINRYTFSCFNIILYVLLTVRLSIILVTDQLNAQILVL